MRSPARLGRAFRPTNALAACAAGLVWACSGSGWRPSAPEAEDAGAPETAEQPTDDGGARRFAKSSAEATDLIAHAVDARREPIARCVQEYRTRKNLAHEPVSIVIGISQQGRLLGVTLAKGAFDQDLSTCVQDELRGVRFPESNAGIITVTKTYQELVR